MSTKDIEGREQDWLKAFNGGDASAVANIYAHGARLLPPNADVIEGRAAIEGFVKDFIATGAQLSFDLITVHSSGDLCAAVGRYEMTFPTVDGVAQRDSGKYIEVWGRQSDGSWQIVDDIFNSSLPPAT